MHTATTLHPYQLYRFGEFQPTYAGLGGLKEIGATLASPFTFVRQNLAVLGPVAAGVLLLAGGTGIYLATRRVAEGKSAVPEIRAYSGGRPRVLPSKSYQVREDEERYRPGLVERATTAATAPIRQAVAQVGSALRDATTGLSVSYEPGKERKGQVYRGQKGVFWWFPFAFGGTMVVLGGLGMMTGLGTVPGLLIVLLGYTLVSRTVGFAAPTARLGK